MDIFTKDEIIRLQEIMIRSLVQLENNREYDSEVEDCNYSDCLYFSQNQRCCSLDECLLDNYEDSDDTKEDEDEYENYVGWASYAWLL